MFEFMFHGNKNVEQAVIYFYEDFLDAKFDLLEQIEENDHLTELVYFFSKKIKSYIFSREKEKGGKKGFKLLKTFLKFIMETWKINSQDYFKKMKSFGRTTKKIHLLELLVIFSYFNFFPQLKWEVLKKKMKNKKNIKFLENHFKNQLILYFLHHNFKSDFIQRKLFDSNFLLEKLEDERNQNLKKMEVFREEKEKKLKKNDFQKDLKENIILNRNLDFTENKELIDFKKAIGNSEKIDKEKKIEIQKLKKKLDELSKKDSFKKQKEIRFFSLSNLNSFKKSIESISLLIEKKTEPFFIKENGSHFQSLIFSYKKLILGLIEELKLFYQIFKNFLISDLS
jgi:hypothetical protein